jgi:protease-4
MKKDEEVKKKGIGKMIIILVSLLFISMILSVILGAGDNTEVLDYNTALITLSGPIYTTGSDSIFEDTTTSEEMVQLIEKASKDSKVKAIIIEINSPGGSPVATDEVSESIKILSEKNITSVAWIREVGASGAYWIASSTDHIIANRMSIVGSIGVYGSYVEWYGLMDIYNVTYKKLVSGKYKDTGTPLRPMTDDEETLIQSKLDKLHEYFIKAVAENRQMSIDNVRELATGEIFLGVEAKDNGLVDELGGKKEAIIYVEKKIGEKVKIKEFNQQKSLLESLMSAMNKNSFYVGRGISTGLVSDSGLKIII